MSSAGIRERKYPILIDTSVSNVAKEPEGHIQLRYGVESGQYGKQITVSQSHRRDRKSGAYHEGGPFYTSHVRPFLIEGHVTDAYSSSRKSYYTGPLRINFPSTTQMKNVGYSNIDAQFGDKNESQMSKDGTNAISYASPVNPASQLGTTLAELIRERFPSPPGVQQWKAKTKFLKGLGSEYLNYQFGWAPLRREVSDVVDAARHHRDVMNSYHGGEGRNTHRRFDYPSSRFVKTLAVEEGPYPGNGIHSSFYVASPNPVYQVSLVRETKRWFEGLFTYALPSSTDSWRKALGFGSEADQLFGLALSPDILWELTPWSWAVDWFSNAGEVINNVTNFGLAGQVMRYGYMMEESIERVTVACNDFYLSGKKGEKLWAGPTASGHETVTKRRVPASPFGFSIGWEGLSPTQLAITAALGITRSL
jgi:hypothetical protein